MNEWDCVYCGWIDGEHTPGCPLEYTDERMYTQGGGVVKYNAIIRRWVFVSDPPHPFEIGDAMPDEWGLAG